MNQTKPNASSSPQPILPRRRRFRHCVVSPGGSVPPPSTNTRRVTADENCIDAVHALAQKGNHMDVIQLLFNHTINRKDNSLRV